MDDGLEQLDRIAEEFPALPEVTPQDTPEYVPAFDPSWRDNFPEEEVAKIRERAERLLKKNDVLLMICVVMGAARQLYQLALVALNRELEQLGLKMEDGTFACLVDSMSAASLQGYQRDRVLQKVQKYALPFLMSEVQREREEIEAEDRKAERDNAEIRRKVRVPVGFPVDGDSPLLGRDRTLVVVGEPSLVARVLNKAAQAALLKREPNPQSPRMVVVRLAAEAFVKSDITRKKNENQVYLRIGVNQWMHRAEGAKPLAKFFTPWLRRTHQGRIDLLVVDDLAQAQKPLIADMPVESVAARGQRALRQWADKAGCAVLAGLPLKELPEKFVGEGWEKLEIHTDVRVVTTRVRGDKTELCLYNPWKKDEPWVVVN